MNTQRDDTLSLRTGMRRIFPRWEFRHLRALGRARIAGGAVLTTCCLLTLGFGGQDSKTYGWAAVFLACAALAFAAGCWQLTIARQAAPRS
jgi:hypothetical protein